MTAANELVLRHDRDRRAAHEEAVRLSERIAAALVDVAEPNRFVALDAPELGRLVAAIAGCQTEYIAADQAYRQVQPEAMKGS